MVFLPDYMTTTPPHDNPRSLWTFTVEGYAKPGVQQASIALQEELGADVNLLFFRVWHAATGRGRLDAADLGRVEARVARWRNEVTQPLRGVRRVIKDDPDLAGLQGAMALRANILGAEVESERIAQIAIESTARPPTALEERPSEEIAGENLASYLTFIDAELDADTAQHLEHFLNGVLS